MTEKLYDRYLIGSRKLAFSCSVGLDFFHNLFAVTVPCRGNPCNKSEICMINEKCNENDKKQGKCEAHICVKGLVLVFFSLYFILMISVSNIAFQISVSVWTWLEEKPILKLK